MFIMSVFGISIVLVLGIINFLLVLFQVLSGFRIIKINYKIHRRTGMILLFTAALHGVLAIIAQ